MAELGRCAPLTTRPRQPGEVITDPNELARLESLIKHKYGQEFRVVTVVETVADRGRKPRVVLRITPSSPT